jgi:hypothetical protein
MEILTQETRSTQTIDRYVYVIDSSLVVSAGSARMVTLTFVNGLLSNVEHNIEEHYHNSPDFWQVMGAIAEKIKDIMKQNA